MKLARLIAHTLGFLIAAYGLGVLSTLLGPHIGPPFFFLVGYGVCASQQSRRHWINTGRWEWTVNPKSIL